MLNTLAWQHVKRRIGARWSGELRIEKSHLQRSSLSADLRPQRSASTSERGWFQPRSHAVARTPYSSPHFGPSRRSDLSQNGIFNERSFEIINYSTLRFFLFLSFLACLEREREKWGGTDLRRTRADHVCLTKSDACFGSVVFRYHQIT